MSLLKRLLMLTKPGGAKKPVNQSNVYSNTIGAIFLVQEGRYAKNAGQIYLWDIRSDATGYYANRT